MSVAGTIRKEIEFYIKEPFNTGVGKLTAFEQKIAFETVIALAGRALQAVSGRVPEQSNDAAVLNSLEQTHTGYTNGYIEGLFDSDQVSGSLATDWINLVKHRRDAYGLESKYPKQK